MIHFDVWGSRGSRSIHPGRSATSCCTSCYSLLDGSDLFVFDAGRGMAALGYAMITDKRFAEVRTIYLLVTHAHMDHWEGLKDAEWFWRRGNGLVVEVLAPAEAIDTIRAGYAHPHYVPLDLLARNTVERLSYREITAGQETTLGRWQVRTAALNHYSGEGDSLNYLDTLGYRLSKQGGPAVAYISDHEPTQGTAAMESAMLSGAHLALLDSHFAAITQHAYGHGSQEYTAGLARRHPGVLMLAGHLSPLFTDAELEAARQRYAGDLGNYRLAAEGDSYQWSDADSAFHPLAVASRQAPDSEAAAKARSKARHDLRTPINQIIGYSELLAEQVEEEGRQDLLADLEKIGKAARRQLELIGELFADPGQAPAAQGPATVPTPPAAAAPPAPVEAPPVEKVSAAIPAGAQPASPAHGKVLVVDDDFGNRDMLARRLAARGFAVAAAEGGQEALDRLAAEPFELVLLDVMMPGMSGLDVLKVIRQTQAASDLPVIMATARDASADVVEALRLGANDYVTKPLDFPVVLARVQTQLAVKHQKDEIERLAEGLEVRNRFIRNTFGRYLSDEVVEGLLESPEGLRLGGESRKVTILMSDLRGFTQVSERLGPEQVVRMLNTYLGAMAEIILNYHGTIDEFIGDAILAIFGAPVSREDDPRRAIACAISMQLAMQTVNAQLKSEGLPALEMGIALHTGDVVVGNIGSQKRTKYGIVGPPVNLAGRIETYTVGGQVLVSEATLREAGPHVQVGEEIHVKGKGASEPITVFDLVGIGGEHGVFLSRREEPLQDLASPAHVRFWILEGKRVGDQACQGALVRLSTTEAEIQLPASDPAGRPCTGVRPLSNLKIQVDDAQGRPVPGDLYAKVLESRGNGSPNTLVRFTSVPPEVEQYLTRLLAEA